MKVLNEQDYLNTLKSKSYPAQSDYLAMYNSLVGGIVKNPFFMNIPIDDHIVHRGDGVFEAMKFIERRLYLLDDHLERLKKSAESISLKLPHSLDEIKNIIIETCKQAEVDSGLVRLYVSRGPGGFSPNPYECVGAQLYIVITHLKKSKIATARIGRSHVPVKPSWLAQIKSCNYLPNVLMKKESVDRKLDFVIGIDEKGFVAESSTENIIIVDESNNLVRPKLHNILKGTTMMRAFALAEKLKAEKKVNDILEKDITETQLINAQEIMMIGTTLDVLPVIEYEGHKIQNGPVAKILLELILKDQKVVQKF